MFCPGCKEHKAPRLAGLKLERRRQGTWGSEYGKQVSRQPGLGAGLVAGPVARALPASGPLGSGSGPVTCRPPPPRTTFLCSRDTLRLSSPLPLTLHNTFHSGTAQHPRYPNSNPGERLLLESLGHMSTPHPTGSSSPGPRISRLDVHSQKREKALQDRDTAWAKA